MTALTPADLAFAAEFALRFLLVCAACCVVAGIVAGRLPEGRR